jgi:hypothetical protein
MSGPGRSYEHRVVAVRATGRAPADVVADIESELPGHEAGWEWVASEPLVFNSSASGYLLFFLRRPVGPSSVSSDETGRLS